MTFASALRQPSAYEQAVDRLLEGLAPVQTVETRAPEAIANEKELDQYLRDRFGVTIPKKRCCAGHKAPWDAFCDAYFARHPVTVWKASRGFGGKSQTLALLGNVEAATLRADVNVLGGTGQQSERVLEAMDRFWQHPTSPRDVLASEPAKKETRFIWGNVIRALMASTASVRGPHPQRLRMDEVDEMDLTILDAAMGQTMARPGIPAQTVLSSTHHYADKTMTEILKRAKDRGWPVYEWCWKETLEPHGWLPEAEVHRKRLEVTETMWLAEYDLQEPSSGARAIDTEAVDRMFKRSLGQFPGTPGKLVQIEGPRRGGRYAHGADWAKKADYTVVWTFRTDVRPMRLVAFIRINRRPWPQMVKLFDDRVATYGGKAAHDETGLGSVIADHMATPGAIGVTLVGRDRADLFSEYIAAIEREECEAPLIDAAHGEHKFASVEDIYAPSGHPPDTFVAGAMAYHAAIKSRKATVATVKAGKPTDKVDPVRARLEARRQQLQVETETYESLRALVHKHGSAAVEAIKRLSDPTFDLPTDLKHLPPGGSPHDR